MVNNNHYYTTRYAALCLFNSFQWISKTTESNRKEFLGAIVTTILNETITWLMIWYISDQRYAVNLYMGYREG